MAICVANVGKALLTGAAVAVGWRPVAGAASGAAQFVPQEQLALAAMVAGPGLFAAFIVFTAGVVVARRYDAPASAVTAPLPCRRNRASGGHLRPVRAQRVAFARGLAGYQRMLNLRLDNLERHLACLPRDAPEVGRAGHA